MKRNYRLYLVILFLVFLFISLEPKQVVAQTSDIDYTFERDLLYDSNNITFNNISFNLRNRTEITQTYNSSYSYTHIPEGDLPNNFIVDSGSGNFSILNDVSGHDKVLNIESWHTAFVIHDEFEASHTTGIVEAWVRCNDSALKYKFFVMEDTSNAVYMQWYNNEFAYFDGIWNVIDVYNPNRWYHIKVEFDINTDWHLWINGTSMDGGAGYGFRGAPTSLTDLEITLEASNNGFLDGLGYSWQSNYTVNNNLYPIMNSIDFVEIDKFEFDLEGIGDSTDFGDDNPSGWTDVEQGGGDMTNIGLEDWVYVYNQGSDHYRGIKRENFNSNGSIVSVSVEIENVIFTSLTGYISINISSYDDIDVLTLHIDYNRILSYWNGNSFIQIIEWIPFNKTVLLDLNINYNDDICVFDYSIDGVYNNTYACPLSVRDEQGLNKVWLYSGTFGYPERIEWRIKSVGIYVNGTSLCDEYSYLWLSLNKTQWHFEHQNLVELNGSGYFSLGSAEGNYTLSTLGTTPILRTGIGIRNYNNTVVFCNIYESYISAVNNPSLVITLLNNNVSFSFSSLSVEGVRLTEGANEYYSTLNYNNININESYFYVIGSRLYYNLTLDDDDLEYMQVSFDIDNQFSENRSISFNTDIDGSSIGVLRLNYTDDTSSLYTFPYYRTGNNYVLPQEKEIDDLIVLITDNDGFSAGLTTGYISNLGLIYIQGITVTIITTTIIMGLIPLFIMLVPTLAVYSKYGKISIVPMFLLMSIVCVASSLIPIWLFFIIIVCLSVLLITKSKEMID